MLDTEQSLLPLTLATCATAPSGVIPIVTESSVKHLRMMSRLVLPHVTCLKLVASILVQTSARTTSQTAHVPGACRFIGAPCAAVVQFEDH
jgi:hypothetical protein